MRTRTSWFVAGAIALATAVVGFQALTQAQCADDLCLGGEAPPNGAHGV